MLSLTRLLPADTRLAELTSALSFFILGLSTLIFPSEYYEFGSFQYAFVFLMLSFLQVFAIACRLLTALRIILSYISGIIWFWIGMSMFANMSSMAHCASVSIALAIGNFYAFVIGIAFLIKKKKQQEMSSNG